MEDSTQKRMSAIPRLSKLPQPRPTSGIPKPASALPRPASTIRPSPSKESLGGGELRNPRLRPSMSRDQLRTGQPDLQQRAQRLRPAVSRDNLNLSAGTRRTSLITRPSGQLSPAKPFAQRTPSTPHRSIERQADIIEEQSTTPPYDPPGGAIGVQYDGNIIPRQLTLTRRPSESFAVSPLYDPPNNIFDPSFSGRPRTASTDDDDRSDLLGAHLKPRPSLSERTAETLANIPSSPALRKTSNFFDAGSRACSSPRSRAGSGASRPGSSYASDGSTMHSSRAGSRPGSSSGQSDHGFSNFRASGTQRVALSPIDGTPRKRSSTVVRTTPSKLPGMPAPSSDARSPSPGKTAIPTPKSGSKSMALRPAKTRAPVQGLFKKPSLPALNKASLNGFSNRRVSVNSASTASWDGTIPSGPSSHNTSMTGESAEPGTPPSARKSSAALREQIAKAKAAKRAQMQQVAENQAEHPDGEAPIVPQDTGFDFGMSQDDPFNLRRGEDPKKKVLQNRVSTARTTGRLNIAALNLKEIPVEVLKMYDLESIGDGSWAESVDLTRFVAADNEFEELDHFAFPDTNLESFDEEQASQGNIFAGLETLDMHGNLLVNVPLGLRRLTCLTSLNLSSNRLTNNSLDTIAQVTSLRDLKLANNLFYGPLNPILASLSELEILDVHGNNISALPHKIENMSRLRILNLSENSFESLPFDSLATLPITELNIRKNKLKGTLIEEPVGCLPQLHTLDASANQLERLVPLGSAIDLPVLHSLSLCMNRLQGLPDMTTWSNLLTLSVEENNISGIPNSFTGLDKLRHADFSSNDIRVIPPEVSRMDNLSMLRLSGNPLRDKKFISITTDELKIILSGRLEPPPPYQEPASQVGIMDILGDAKVAGPNPGSVRSEEEDYRSDDNFATPPQSPNRSRSHTVSSRRSRSHTLSNQSWPVKPGGILDRSQTESSSLHPVVCSKVAAEHRVRQIFLQNNLFATLPNSLSFFAETLTALSLSHNQLRGEAYLTEELDMPVLRELNLASNHITGLGALVEFLHAPILEKIDVTMNRINCLPADLKATFPSLNVLLASNNHIVDLEPEMIKGLKIVDVSNNDIAHLNPRIGLLGGLGGLERFEVAGNRFRVPRWNVIERGTDATLRWLRGRVPVAEMASWQGDDEEPEVD
ncbi:receptor kinase 5 precursor [Fusarium heterosporum]|uniref:Receptor kinase 5 n=1 Tax=Fusarium heterosporum TaxID=42747 RepID=A0A8H5WUF6_FUSHE|nr:receptor kinase 5 precursor [Fusarium heterosporum]